MCRINQLEIKFGTLKASGGESGEHNGIAAVCVGFRTLPVCVSVGVL